MVDGTITTGFDRNSDTLMFSNVDTPSGAYTALTEAVYGAMGYEGYSMIDVENLPRDTNIGEATYDEDSGKVTSLTLYDWVLDDFGFES